LEKISSLLHAYGAKRGWDEIIGGWRKLHNDELHNWTYGI
jgi:hypothetical protein